MSARCTCWNVTTCATNRRLGSTSHGENVPHKQHWPLPFKTETERAYLQTGEGGRQTPGQSVRELEAESSCSSFFCFLYFLRISSVTL